MPEEVFEQFLTYYGQVWGNANYDIVRPEYTQVASPEHMIAPHWRCRCDKTGSSNLPEPFIFGAEYYSVFGPRFVQPGDVFIPNPAKLGAPKLTMQNIDTVKEAVAFRSDRLANISVSSEVDPHWKNVYFDFCGVDGPGEALAPGFEGGPDMAQRRAVMFYRDNVKPLQKLFDIATNTWYQLTAVNVLGPAMELYMKAEG